MRGRLGCASSVIYLVPLQGKVYQVIKEGVDEQVQLTVATLGEVPSKFAAVVPSSVPSSRSVRNMAYSATYSVAQSLFSFSIESCNAVVVFRNMLIHMLSLLWQSDSECDQKEGLLLVIT